MPSPCPNLYLQWKSYLPRILLAQVQQKPRILSGCWIFLHNKKLNVFIFLGFSGFLNSWPRWVMGVLFRVGDSGDAIGHKPGRWRYDESSGNDDSGDGSSSGSNSTSDSVLLGGIHCYCILASLETSYSISRKDWGEYVVYIWESFGWA